MKTLTTILLLFVVTMAVMAQTVTDTRDGKIYKTVQIGTQCWMAENLNVGTMIPYTGNQTNNGVIEKYCYNNIESNCDVYGGQYQWTELMQYSTNPGSQGICMTGWHVPTWSEWMVVIDAYGGLNLAGKALKESGYAHWRKYTNSQWYATNGTGMTLLPNGSIIPPVRSVNMTVCSYAWTSTRLRGDYFNPQWEDASMQPVQISSTYTYPWAAATTMYDFVADGVRCIKD